MNKFHEAANQLIAANKLKTPCSPVRHLIGETSQENAYSVQHIITQSKLKNGAVIIGKKIGLTSVKVQTQLGVDQPDFGMLFDDMEIKNGGNLSISETMQPKVEAEIAFVLKSDLMHKNPTMEEVEDAIEYAVAAIEIVGSRIANWDIKITDTIADNASASHFVLGTQQKTLAEIDLANSTMEMQLNGETVSEGTGAACLGSPLIAVHWLATKMAAIGSPLQRGDIILSGALGPMANVVAGDKVTAKISGLGEVKIVFTK